MKCRAPTLLASIPSIALMSTFLTKKSEETGLSLLKSNWKIEPNQRSEAWDVVDNIVVDCKVLFLQCLGSDHLVYLIWKILGTGAKLPCYCFHFVLFLKRFSCQLNTFSDTPSPPSLLVLFSFHLAMIDNISIPVCTQDKDIQRSWVHKLELRQRLFVWKQNRK